MKNNKGFTLVELIIVIAILAIIMLIAIPNFSGIQQRMQVRADKATAAQIGKAVRVWFTDCTTDSGLISEHDGTAAATVTNGVVTVEGKYAPEDLPVKAVDNTTPTRYENLIGIKEYISWNQVPSSMKGTVDGTDKGQKIANQVYGVFLTADETSADAKIVVAIVSSSETGYMTINTSAATLTAGYDGNGAGIAYIEP
ncbi:MAG: prepilin-type N-terminal cleavage/methylation domain-containing protein [Clostridia bacterium]|nr:prepilin-type N-terminal cleavage/methylation domain-containing protein [Clostridia bacterium]